MAQATLREVARPPAPPADTVSAPSSADAEGRGGVVVRPNRWAARYAYLGVIAILAMALVGVRAAVSQIEAVRYKLQEAVANEQAKALRLVQEINASLGPAARTAVINERRLTREPAAVIELATDQPLPPVRPSPVTTAQPVVVAQAAPQNAGAQARGMDYAGVR
ncbi:MAG: hypothetical protein H5T86_07790 [Armatimonadetes bacterium]|nr:hypothetical protein [Armatimonadota bacterium]